MEMEKRIEEDLAREEATFSKTHYIRTLVDYTAFLDGVAELIGCAPKLTDYLGDPPLLYKLGDPEIHEIVERQFAADARLS